MLPVILKTAFFGLGQAQMPAMLNLGPTERLADWIVIKASFDCRLSLSHESWDTGCEVGGWLDGCAGDRM